LFLGLGASAQAEAQPAGAQAEFSQAFMKALRQRDPQKQKQLILDYERVLRLEPQEPFEGTGVVSLLEVNLDASPALEVVALLGRRESDLELAVFRETPEGWVLAGREQVQTWYYPPELGILATQPHATFFVRQLEERGTGIFKESLQLYKLLNGQLTPVLRLPLEARIYGWGLKLNQHLVTHLQGLSGPDDRLRVRYLYRFFAGPALGELSWSSHQESRCLEGDESVDYLWNASKKRYEPDFYPEHPLSPLKLQSLETFGDSVLFAKAFQKELRERLKTASSQDQACLKHLPGLTPQ